jgi:hypothetical protein
VLAYFAHLERAMRTNVGLTLLGLAACAHGPDRGAYVARSAAQSPVAAQAPITSPCAAGAQVSHAERIAKHGTALDTYQLQDGVWLPHAPVLVNEPFDFVLAMGMEGGIGAGLAASKRKKNNQKRAEALHELRFDDAMSALLEELRCCGNEVYFLLWGTEGIIRMVVDKEGEGKVVDGAQAASTEAATVLDAGEMLRGVDCRQPPGA